MHLTAYKDTHGIAKGDCFYDDKSITERSWDLITMMNENPITTSYAAAVTNLTAVALNATSNTDVTPTLMEGQQNAN